MDKSGQDEFIESGMPKKVDKINIKKKRKIYLRDKRAPKPPHSGYVRFLNDRRQQFCSQNSNLQFSEITKALATEWNNLPSDIKQPYLTAAKQDRAKYTEELAAYKKTDAYRNFIEFKTRRNKINNQKEREFKKGKPSTDNKLQKYQELKKEKPSSDYKFKKDQELKKGKPSNDNKHKKDQELKKEKPSSANILKKDQELKKDNPSTANSETAYDISIFSEEFLNFNKARESELRILRKNVIDQDQEVCVLEKHIENMEKASIELLANTQKLKARCLKFEEQLTKLRPLLLDALANTAFPDNNEPLTTETIDSHMVNLYTLLTPGSDTDPSWIANIKKSLSNLDLSQMLK